MSLLPSSHKGVPVDPQLSTAKRQQRAHALNTTLSQAAIERKLAAAETTRLELETRLRERETTIERLEADRRWLAEREQEEREEKERLSKEREEEKVSNKSFIFDMYVQATLLLDQSRPGSPLLALCPEYPPRRPRRSPRQIRRTLPHHIPKARRPNCRAYSARAPSRVPHRRTARGARSCCIPQHRSSASAIRT